MSWKSAGDVFDRVAQALVDLGASHELKRRVLGPLIEVLRDGDWDGEEHSLARFADDPDIVAVFAEHDVVLPEAVATST